LRGNKSGQRCEHAHWRLPLPNAAAAICPGSTAGRSIASGGYSSRSQLCLCMLALHKERPRSHHLALLLQVLIAQPHAVHHLLLLHQPPACRVRGMPNVLACSLPTNICEKKASPCSRPQLFTTSCSCTSRRPAGGNEQVCKGSKGPVQLFVVLLCSCTCRCCVAALTFLHQHGKS